MRYASLTLALLLAPTAAADVALVFEEPAAVRGDLGGTTNGWFAARLPQGSRLDLELLEPGRLVMTNTSYPGRLEMPVATYEAAPPDTVSSSRPLDPMRLTLVAGLGGATVAMQASGEIRGAGDAVVVSLGEFGMFGALGNDGVDLNKGWSGWSRLSQRGVALVSEGGLQGVMVERMQVTAIEWFNVQVECSIDKECPSGGGTQHEQVGSQGFYFASTTFRFERIEGPTIASAAWPVADVALAGPSLDVWTAGEAHLPVAEGVACAECPPIRDQTITVGGNVRVDRIREHDGGFAGRLSGDFESARIDETWVSPTRLGQAGVVGAAMVGLAFAVKLLLAPLFTRLTKQEALEHPKRQRIFTYVQEHPGANFREVARSTGIAAGTVRHHLTVLERAGHLVEHQHLGTVRLFENHGKFDRDWADVVLLREPPLAKLHQWITEHPNSAQKDALEAMEREGWSRSTTQHRLSRLVDGGLVAIRLQGRLKIYCPVDRGAPQRIAPAWSPRVATA